jgi:hypothetical protein
MCKVTACSYLEGINPFLVFLFKMLSVLLSECLYKSMSLSFVDIYLSKLLSVMHPPPPPQCSVHVVHACRRGHIFMFMSETACFILVTFGIDCLTWHIDSYWSGITPAIHYIQSEHKRTLHFQYDTENKCGIPRTSHLHQLIKKLSEVLFQMTWVIAVVECIH